MGLVRQEKSNVACRPVAGRKKCLKGDYTGSIARRATNDSSNQRHSRDVNSP